VYLVTLGAAGGLKSGPTAQPAIDNASSAGISVESILIP
jgi:hypothetical protein